MRRGSCLLEVVLLHGPAVSISGLLRESADVTYLPGPRGGSERGQAHGDVFWCYDGTVERAPSRAERLGPAHGYHFGVARACLAPPAPHSLPVADADWRSVPVLRRDTRRDRSWAGPPSGGIACLAARCLWCRGRDHPARSAHDEPRRTVAEVACENTQHRIHCRYCGDPCRLRGLAARA